VTVLEVSPEQLAMMEQGFSILIRKLAAEQNLTCDQAISCDPSCDFVFVGRKTIRIGISKINEEKNFLKMQTDRVLRLLSALYSPRLAARNDAEQAVYHLDRLGCRPDVPQSISAVCAVAHTEIERWET
jgi:hypothetical protein